MRYYEFKEKAEKSAESVANKILPNTKRISNERVRNLIINAYYSGCLNTFDQISKDPDIIRKKIGFIQ